MHAAGIGEGYQGLPKIAGTRIGVLVDSLRLNALGLNTCCREGIPQGEPRVWNLTRGVDRKGLAQDLFRSSPGPSRRPADAARRGAAPSHSGTANSLEDFPAASNNFSVPFSVEESQT